MDNRLYSPWRLRYVLSKKSEECIFCIKPKAENDEKHLILHRSKHSFVIMNTFPYNNGHLMVVPNRHLAVLSALNKQELSDLFELVQLTEKILNIVYSPDGINIGINLGRAAGAGIDQHLHVHLVPRWNGDVNFLSSLSGTRVIPESFERAYRRLKEEFDKAEEEK